MQVRRAFYGALSFLLLGTSSALAQTDPAPFTPEQPMLMSDVAAGPYSDYLAVDADGHRLFATPQASKAVAVFDLTAHRLLQLITGFGNPHGVAYNAATKRLFVADSGQGVVHVFEGDDFKPLKTITLDNGADWMIADPSKPIVYVNHGGEDAKMDHAIITAIDVNTMAPVGDIVVDTKGLEQSTIDPGTRRLYQALVHEDAIAVIDLDKGAVVATWKLEGGRPFTVALDSQHGRLFVGSRDTDTRGSISVLDLENGKQLDRLPIFGWIDSMYFDAKRQRIFGSLGMGMIESFEALPTGNYRKLEPIDTAVMAKTSLFVPQTGNLYVSVPHLGSTPAQIKVFKAQP